MLYNLLKNPSFTELMESHLGNMILYLFDNNQEFSVFCNIDAVHFDPILPSSIRDQFSGITLFSLMQYSFETARLDEDSLLFEAAFGEEDFPSLVSIPLIAIVQIIIDDTPIMINLALPSLKTETQKSAKVNDEGVQNSMSALLSNPENQKFIKK